MSNDDDKKREKSILNKIEDLLDTYFLYYWMVFLAIVGCLFYYISYKKIFSRGLLKWIYIIFFTIYICISIISILYIGFVYKITDGFTKPFA